jgi:hypothetical protein
MTIMEDALRTNQSKLHGRLMRKASSANALPLSRHWQALFCRSGFLDPKTP